MGDEQIMMAVKTGTIRQVGRAAGVIVKRGVTTAHAGHEIVTNHPHLWAPVRVDFAVEQVAESQLHDDIFAAASSAAGLRWAEALRRLAKGLHERGFDLPETGGVDDVTLPDRIVDVALAMADFQTGRSEVAPMRRVELPEFVEEPLQDDPPPAGPGEVPGDGEHELVDEFTEPAVGAAEQAGEVANMHTTEGRRAIRAWAKDEGIEVAASGPLPGDVVTQYYAAHGATPPAPAE